MKTPTATIAAFAAFAALSAAPAMAENTAYEQNVKLERLLEHDMKKDRMAERSIKTPKRSTERAISTRMLTGPEKAKMRLFGFQNEPAGR